jgi:hypothetical protein
MGEPYNPPPLTADIADILEYEARFMKIAAIAGDECTEGYARMCRRAAYEIRKLRKALAEKERADG